MLTMVCLSFSVCFSLWVLVSAWDVCVTDAVVVVWLYIDGLLGPAISALDRDAWSFISKFSTFGLLRMFVELLCCKVCDCFSRAVRPPCRYLLTVFISTLIMA